MKFTVDTKDAFTLLDWHKLLIKNDIPLEIFDDDMRRRAVHCVETPVHQCLHASKEELCKSLAQLGVTEIPGQIEAFCEFVGCRNDMGFDKSEISGGCGLECDSTNFHTVSNATLTLVKSFLKKEEGEYLTSQLQWIFNEKIKGCLRRMHTEWDPKLASRNINIPLDPQTFVNLVISQTDYKDRSARDSEI